MDVVIDNRQGKIQIDEEIIDSLEEIASICLRAEGQPLSYEVSISFVDDEEIRALNKEYRGMDKPTDVLSFPLLGGEEEPQNYVPMLLGDIVISAETALRQSEEYSHSFKREVAYLTVHSMLHLLGYDHIDEEDKKEMRQREKEIIKLLGIYKNNDSKNEGV